MTPSPEDCAATVLGWKNPVEPAQTSASAKEAVIQRTLLNRCTRILLYGRTDFANTRGAPPDKSLISQPSTGPRRRLINDLSGGAPRVFAKSVRPYRRILV